MTQTERVLRHLKDFGSITTLEAFREYGITRLSARIYDLKMQGYGIEAKKETARNRYGEKVSFNTYRLAAE